MNNIINEKECQEKISRLVKKIQMKKYYNKTVVDFLYCEGEIERATRVKDCATHIGFAYEDNVVKISSADFCRERMCHVCCWRKQSKFVAVMTPVLQEVKAQGYEFIFLTLTVQNVGADLLSESIDMIMRAYNKFLGRKKVQVAFVGSMRSVEITYNEKENTYHPHVHVLAVVDPDYFSDPTKYISQRELCALWRDCACLDYEPICHVEKVSNLARGQLETLKYALKPTRDWKALECFFSVLKGRRLISFCGILKKYRKEYDASMSELSDFVRKSNYNEYLYKFDVTGGVYRFYEQQYHKRE